jgi:hypothetical protein
MNIRTVILVVMTLFIGVSANAFAKDKGGGKHFVFNLVGAGPMYESTVPDIDGDEKDDPAICFDVDLVNMQNQQIIGTATDCLSNITPVGTGLALVGTSIFNLPSGTIMTRGKTTVQPVLQPIVTPNGQVITHTTGASGIDNAILGGSGQFKNATGTARLSGMVDLTDFGGLVGDPIAFDCLFVIDLD